MLISFNFLISEQFIILFVWIKICHGCIFSNKRFQKIHNLNKLTFDFLFNFKAV